MQGGATSSLPCLPAALPCYSSFVDYAGVGQEIGDVVGGGGEGGREGEREREGVGVPGGGGAHAADAGFQE